MKPVTIKIFFTQLWTEIMSQYPPILISTAFYFLWKIWFNDGVGANAVRNSHFPVMQWHFVDLVGILHLPNTAICLLTPSESVQWVSLAIKICFQKVQKVPRFGVYFSSDCLAVFQVTVDSMVCVNCTLYGKKKSILQNAPRSGCTLTPKCWAR